MSLFTLRRAAEEKTLWADREDNNQVELDSKFNHNDLEAVELGQLHLYFKITSTMLAGYKFVDLVICYTIMRKKKSLSTKD